MDYVERAAQLKAMALRVPAWRGVWKSYDCKVLVGYGRAVVLSDDNENEHVLLDACGDVEALERALASLLAGEPSAAEQELQKRVGELEQLLAVQRHEGLLSIARRERDQFEQELQRLRAELAEAKAVAKAACETMATEPRKQERELRDGVRALLAEYTREVGTDPQRQVTREQVPVPHDRLRKLL